MLRAGDYVRTTSGATGKIVSLKLDGTKAKVRLVSGSREGQVREFKQSSLTRV